MVESTALDTIFMALSDQTRREILALVAKTHMSIGEIAQHFKLTFAAVSKHIKVLERAQLISKQRHGKEQRVIIVPDTLGIARSHIERYAELWSDRFAQLDTLLKEPRN